MRTSRITIWSAVRLAVRRALSGGGLTQLIMPVALSIVVWLVFSAVVAVLLRTGAVELNALTTYRQGLEDKGPLGIAFYHLFTAGGVDMIKGGPGWVVSIIGLVLVALLTSIFTNYFIEAANEFKEGRSDFKFSDHIAIFGFGRSVPDLLKQMLNGEYSACRFLIITSGRVPEAVARLVNVLTPSQLRRVVIIRGDMASASGVKRMQVSRAQEIFIPGEGGGDGQSLQCLKMIASAIPDGRKIPCYMQIESRTASSVFQYTDMDAVICGRLEFVPFNSLDLWAHKIFVKGIPFEGAEGIGPDSAGHVHLVIAGMTPAGMALGIEAMRLAHYPNAVLHPDRRTRISFVDTGMEMKMNKFRSELPHLYDLVRRRSCSGKISGTKWLVPRDTGHLGGDFLDFELEFIDAGISSPEVRTYLESVRAGTRLTVAMCQDSVEEALDAAVSLPAGVYDKALQVLVYQPGDGIVAETLASGSNVTSVPFRKLKPFGMSPVSFDLSLLKDLLRDANALHIDTSGASLASRSSASQLWSDIYCACHSGVKLRSAGNDPSGTRYALARAEHNRWNADQLLMNFRPLTAGEQKAVMADASLKSSLKRDKRAHLDICSWEKLTEIDPSVIEYDYRMVDRALQTGS